MPGVRALHNVCNQDALKDQAALRRSRSSAPPRRVRPKPRLSSFFNAASCPAFNKVGPSVGRIRWLLGVYGDEAWVEEEEGGGRRGGRGEEV